MSEEENDVSTRSSKADVVKYISYALDLIAKNATKAQVQKGLREEFKLSQQQSQTYFIRATEQLEDDLADKVKAIRNRRIHSLNKDIDEAYSNYLAEADSALKIKWYDIYFKLKNQLDSYYPNKLAPEADKDELKIQIHYKKITELSKEDE